MKSGSEGVEIEALVLLRRGPIGLFAIQALHRLHRRDVSRVAQRLVRRGWARLEPDPEDRRARRLLLTPKGRALADRLSCERSAGLEEVSVTLPAAVFAGLVRTLAYRAATGKIPDQDQALLEALTAASLQKE